MIAVTVSSSELVAAQLVRRRVVVVVVVRRRVVVAAQLVRRRVVVVIVVDARTFVTRRRRVELPVQLSTQISVLFLQLRHLAAQPHGRIVAGGGAWPLNP